MSTNNDETGKVIEGALKPASWMKIEVVGDCWVWRGKRYRSRSQPDFVKKGYGMSWDSGARKYVSAHRRSYSEFRGGIPAGHGVLHRCDNPPCVNPDHLFTGTQRDNVRDAWGKGRGVHQVYHGSAHPMAKLTSEEVRLIVSRVEGGEQQKALAEEYGVSRATVCRIAKGVRKTP